MERIDTLSDKHTYSLHRIIFRINRAVCLFYPEYGVPWFHKGTVDNLSGILRESNKKKEFKYGVEQALKEALGPGSPFRSNSLSEYYNLIDFELHIDPETRQVVNPTDASNAGKELEKVAILVDIRVVDGYEILLGGLVAMSAEELRRQGYKVLVIDKKMWNTLKMSGKHSRTSYLRQELNIQYEHLNSDVVVT